MNISEFKLFLAKSAYAPKEILEILSKDEDWDVRESVAKNPNMPKKAFKLLAKDEYFSVRSFVAKNLI